VKHSRRNNDKISDSKEQVCNIPPGRIPSEGKVLSGDSNQTARFSRTLQTPIYGMNAPNHLFDEYGHCVGVLIQQLGPAILLLL
jgi:hypothetical protein